MEQKNRNILAERPELKEMPFSIPEGYFDTFKAQMRPHERPLWKKVMPYASAAAALLFLFTAGALLLRSAAYENELTQEDFLVFSSDIGNTAEYYEYSEQLAEAEIGDEDIIEYLIYCGISAEEIEHYKE